MAYQTAAGARAAFLAKLQTIPQLANLAEDAVEPAALEGAFFATLLEGSDTALGTIIGGTRPLYEMASEVDLIILTKFKDKDTETALRKAISDAIEADPHLGDAVDDVVLSQANNDINPAEGSDAARSVLLRATLFYISTSPVG